MLPDHDGMIGESDIDWQAVFVLDVDWGLSDGVLSTKSDGAFCNGMTFDFGLFPDSLPGDKIASLETF